MKLAIADPPYPPSTAAGGPKRRATRWYAGDHGVATADRGADNHPNAAEWDDPARHAALLAELVEGYDGWAIATTPDGIAAYGPLPAGTRIMAWIKPGATPGAHRIQSCWEPVILYPPAGRRSSRTGGLGLRDVLTAAPPRTGFVGAKPAAWTHWVLEALGYCDDDELTDMFPGSGAVTAAAAQGRLGIDV